MTSATIILRTQHIIFSGLQRQEVIPNVGSTYLLRRTHALHKSPNVSKCCDSVKYFQEADNVKDDSFVETPVGQRDLVPPKHKISLGLFVAFILCNMDKVNMSLAIIPMSEEFGWDHSIAGIVQSSFFWGLLLFQVPGGILCSKLGGKKVMPMGVRLWSLAIAGVPLWAGTIPGICLFRAAVGLGEATAPSASTDMVARIVPKEERSRTLGFVFGGLHVGSIAGLLIVPSLSDSLGWPSVFLILGGMGLAWVFWFDSIVQELKESNPETYKALTGEDFSSTSILQSMDIIPWRAVLRSRPVQALAFAHFCTNWFGYSMMAWLPSYITSTLSMDISNAAQVSLLPPVAGFICGLLSGQLADHLISRGWKTSTVRKLVQSIAYLFPTACLSIGWLCDNSTMEVGCVALAIGFASFCMGGLYSNHQDLSLKFSSFLLGLTNTVAAIPGVLGVWLTGYLYETTRDWHLSLFFPAIVMMVLGTVVYLQFGSSDSQLFDDNSPFRIEKYIKTGMGKTNE